MIIPKQDLIITTTPNGDKIVRHRIVRIQLFLPSLDTINRNKIYVQKIDGLGNIKSNDVYDGFTGFWDATTKFEDFIAEELGVQEVLGFEVGMVFELAQDIGNFRAGQILVVTEVGPDGSATTVRPISQSQVQTLSNSMVAIPLSSPEDLDILKNIGVTRLSDIESDKTYALQSAEDFILLPDKYDFKQYKVNLEYLDNSVKPNVTVIIQNIGFVKQTDGTYKIGARVKEKGATDEYFTELVNLNSI